MYGIEVRKLVINLVEKGHKSVAEIGKFLKISTRSIVRWKALAQKDRLAPNTHVPRRRKLDQGALISYVKDNPDHTLSTMAQYFNVSPSSIWRKLELRNITLKKRQLVTKREMKLDVMSL